MASESTASGIAKATARPGRKSSTERSVCFFQAASAHGRYTAAAEEKAAVLRVLSDAHTEFQERGG